jgi:hypothetical protein
VLTAKWIYMGIGFVVLGRQKHVMGKEKGGCN